MRFMVGYVMVISSNNSIEIFQERIYKKNYVSIGTTFHRFYVFGIKSHNPVEARLKTGEHRE
jgi:hypothetical protein